LCTDFAVLPVNVIVDAGFISKAAKLALPHNSAKLNFIPDFFKYLLKIIGKLINRWVKINFSGKKL
jgi:hypothetical protein